MMLTAHPPLGPKDMWQKASNLLWKTSHNFPIARWCLPLISADLTAQNSTLDCASHVEDLVPPHVYVLIWHMWQSLIHSNTNHRQYTFSMMQYAHRETSDLPQTFQSTTGPIPLGTTLAMHPGET